MKKGDRISYQGQSGIIVEATHVTPGMIDVRLDSEDFVRRASKGELALRNGGTSLKDLRKIAKGLGIRGFSRMSADQLREAIGVTDELRRHAGTLENPLFGEEWVVKALASLSNEEDQPVLAAQLQSHRFSESQIRQLEDLEAKGQLPEHWADGILATLQRFAQPVKRQKTVSTRDFDVPPRKIEIEQIRAITRKKGPRRYLRSRDELADKQAEELEQIGFWPSLPAKKVRVSKPRPPEVDKLLEALGKIRAEMGNFFDPEIYLNKGWDDEKLIDQLQKTIHRESELLERLRSANRARSIFGKPESRVVGNINEQLRFGSGIGVFTRPDPLRLAADNKTFCGNAIDGTAYFVAVANRTKTQAHFITWSELLRQGMLEGRIKLGSNSFETLVTPRKVINATTRDAILERFLTPYMIQITRPENNWVAPLVREITEAGWVFDLPTGESVCLGGLETREDESSPWRLVPAAAGSGKTLGGRKGQTEEADFQLALQDALKKASPSDHARIKASFKAERDRRAGRLHKDTWIRLVVPSIKLLKDITYYYDNVYTEKMRKDRVRFYDVSLRPTTMGKVGRGKSSRRAKGPDASIAVGGNRMDGGGYRPSPGISFSRLRSPDYKEQIFTRRDVYTPPAKEIMADFKPFAHVMYQNSTRKNIPVVEALVTFSQNQRPRISTEVAEMLVRSGMVYLTTKGAKGATYLALPEDHVEPLQFVHIGNAEKGQDPYFNWVTTIVPQMPKDRLYSKCLTPEEKRGHQIVLTMIRALEQVKNSLLQLRNIRSNPEGTKASDLLFGLGKALARYTKELRRLREEMTSGSIQEQAAAFVALRVLDKSGLKLNRADSPYIRIAEIAEELGLVFDGESDVNTAVRQAVFLVGNANSDKPAGGLYKRFVEGRRLGSSGLKFLSGDVTYKANSSIVEAFNAIGIEGGVPTVHPLDDYFTWLAVATNNFRNIKPWAKGASILRKDADPSGLFYPDAYNYADKSQQPWIMADEFGQAVAALSRGGERFRQYTPRAETQHETFSSNKFVHSLRGTARIKSLKGGKEKESFSEHFRLPKVPGLEDREAKVTWIENATEDGISFSEQIDRNAVNGYILTTLIRDYARHDKPIYDLRNQLLLAMLYFELGGYALTGSLYEPTSVATRMERDLISVEEQISALLGGKPLGGSLKDDYTVFMTYNPALFELTRLYFPGTRASEHWNGLLTQPKLLTDVDHVGRYGIMAQILQSAILATATEEDIPVWLQANLLDPWHKAVIEANTDATTFAEEVMLNPQASQPMKVFGLLWPIELTITEAFQFNTSFVQQPMAVFKQAKKLVSRIVPKLITYREAGINVVSRSIWQEPEVIAVLKGQVPALIPGQISEPLGSILQSLVVKRTGLTSKSESDALKAFQKKPGKYRLRNQHTGMVQLKNIPAISPTGVYDARTLEALGLIQMSNEIPPGIREYGGQTQTPWLLRKGLTKAGTDKTDIYNESVLAQVEQRRMGINKWIGHIDSLVKDIEEFI